ncbi:class III lanthipeptide, partial [Bacillus cereus group sp. BfR-BA-01352]
QAADATITTVTVTSTSIWASTVSNHC